MRARVVSVRRISQGDSVSYGAEWLAKRDTWLATLGIGYADGVPRNLNLSGAVLLNGRRLTLAGRITMDMTMVDVGPD
ncbi:alanine racemase C-terminal domain-containing protein, partial [Salmonella sp. SAL4434]|uniref:alanine racemase C-terminal domain-containing protein n=1 Tax=Salmonella sp. SAL4434 TaxID=3159889 RepID=UPI00397ABFD4